MFIGRASVVLFCCESIHKPADNQKPFALGKLAGLSFDKLLDWHVFIGRITGNIFTWLFFLAGTFVRQHNQTNLDPPKRDCFLKRDFSLSVPGTKLVVL